MADKITKGIRKVVDSVKAVSDMATEFKKVVKAYGKAMMLSPENKKIAAKNEHWQSELGWRLGDVNNICKGRGYGIRTNGFVKMVKSFQRRNRLKPDGVIGPNTWSAMVETTLNPCEKAVKQIFDATITRESGGNYAAMNRDGEYRGLFNRAWQKRHGRNHPAYQRCHIGLSFGIIQFTQDGGSLGVLLQKAAQTYPEKFKATFGETWHQLLNVLTTEGESGFSRRILRGPRVKKIVVKVGDELVEKDIWEEPWVSKFKNFGNDVDFQKVQRQVALEEYLEPMYSFMRANGLLSEKSVAACFSASVHRGPSGAQSFLTGSSLGHSEWEFLQHLAARSDRYEEFLNDDTLSIKKWAGWEACDV